MVRSLLIKLGDGLFFEEDVGDVLILHFIEATCAVIEPEEELSCDHVNRFGRMFSEDSIGDMISTNFDKVIV